MSRVTINAGGLWYETTRETIDKSARLRSEAGADIFVDRDGTLFGYVLGYLRTGVLITPRDSHLLRLIAQEAKFYELPELESHATEMAAQALADPFEGAIKELASAILALQGQLRRTGRLQKSSE